MDSGQPFLANGFSAALCAIECLKLCLNIGNVRKDMLLFDLLNMEFEQADSKAVSYTHLDVYKRQIAQRAAENPFAKKGWPESNVLLPAVKVTKLLNESSSVKVCRVPFHWLLTDITVGIYFSFNNLAAKLLT